MSKDVSDQRLEVLILALLSKKVSMSYLLASGFTPGQVMRALINAKDAGYVAISGKKTELSKLGLERMMAYKVLVPKAKWISPADSQRISAVSVTDIVLPEEDDVLD